MPGAVIVIDQPGGAGPGIPGYARNDIWNNIPVQLSVGALGNTTYQWTLLAIPTGSVSVLDTPTSETCSFVPDMVGTYRIRLITNGGGGLGNTSILVARVRFDEFGALSRRGWAYPAYGEKDGESNYDGNLKGWARNLEDILEDVRINFAGSDEAIATIDRDLIADADFLTGMVVSVNSASRAVLADAAGTEEEMTPYGLIKEVVAPGDVAEIITSGIALFPPGGLTPGQSLYLAEGGGYPTPTNFPNGSMAGRSVVRIGQARTANSIQVKIQLICRT